MNAVLTYSSTTIKNNEIVQGFFGSIFLAICSLIWVPTEPVAVTMQVLALFILALQYSPRICLITTLYYLGEATVGLPVLGAINPLWFIGGSAGYLFAFPFAAYLMSFIAYKSNSLIRQFFALLVGLVLIYFMGYVWLAAYIGAHEALFMGVIFFIPFDLMKIGLAIYISNYLKNSR